MHSTVRAVGMALWRAGSALEDTGTLDRARMDAATEHSAVRGRDKVGTNDVAEAPKPWLRARAHANTAECGV